MSVSRMPSIGNNDLIKNETSSSLTSFAASSKRKLILHFDQHNTIQVASSLPDRKLTVEEGLNNFLTSACWGKENIENEWEWISNEPQLNKPKHEPNAITYFKYLEKKIVKNPDDRPMLKKQTARFVYDEPGIKFRDFFDLYLESLTYEHNFDSESPMPPNCIGGGPKNTSLYHLILPEFFDMIRRLQKNNREFVIILRTMGIESETFLDTIQAVFEDQHRDFKDIKPIKINTQVGKIERDLDNKVKLIMGDEVYDNDLDIYNKLCSLTGINAIRDDFAFWQKNDYNCYAAKPLWIDFSDPLHHHIIFDDNIRLDALDDCIVNLRCNESRVRKQFVNIDFESYKLFENCCLIQPNLIELLNPHLKLDSKHNHYFEKIRKAEIKFNSLVNKLNSYTKPFVVAHGQNETTKQHDECTDSDENESEKEKTISTLCSVQ